MSDRRLHSDPAYLRAIAARDPLGAYLYVRSLRSAYVRAMVSELLRFVWRHIRQQFKASPWSTGGAEPLEPVLPLKQARAQNEGQG